MGDTEHFVYIHTDVSCILLRELDEDGDVIEILCNPLPKVFRETCFVSSSPLGCSPMPLGDKFSWHHGSIGKRHMGPRDQ